MLSSFYPVVAGRTSDAQSRYRSLYNVQVSQQSIQLLQDQLSTGHRIFRPSDDPTAAIRVIGIQRDLEFRDQTLRNLDSSQSYLNVTESTLSNVQDVLTQVRGLGIEGSGNVATDAERAGWVSQVNASIDRLTSAANTTYLDRFLFSGGDVSNPTVRSVNNLIRSNGNDQNLLTIANDGEYIAHNVTGQRAFGLISDGVVSTVDLNPAAIAITQIADLNQGQGVSQGAIQFSDGDQRVSVDLATSATLGDVLERINGRVSLGGRAVQASLVNGSLVVNYADGNGGVLRINNVGSGRTASDLGIESTTPAPALPINGTPLKPILKPTTTLAQLNGGTGFDANDGITIDQNGVKRTVLLGTATTIEDLTNLINQSGAAVKADITPDGRNLRVRSTESGSDFSIGEFRGKLAERLGLRTFTANTRLDQLNFGRGVNLVDGPDIGITRNDGSELLIDLNGTTTIQDVIDKVNNNITNQDARTRVTLGLNATGNGVTISSPVYVQDPLRPVPPTPPGPIKIRSINGSNAGIDLGWIPKGAADATSVESPPGTYAIVGADTNPQEVKGVFNSLIRLRSAITNKDTGETNRAISLLDQDLSRLSLSRGTLGVQQQRIDDLKTAQQDGVVELKADESRNYDTDFTAAISDLTARQTAYEASLKLLASTTKISMFDFL